jgi:ligand-binding sensor domain-containing protein
VEAAAAGGSLDAPAAVAVSPDDGVVWIGRGTLLVSFGFAGQGFVERALGAPTRALAADAAHRTLWVATAAGVESRDLVSGLGLDSFRLSEPRDLALEGASGELWIAAGDGLWRLDLDGGLHHELAMSDLALVESDGSGGLWLAAGRSLLRRAPGGGIAVDLRPFAGDRPIRHLVADPATRSAWVSDGRAVIQVTADGRSSS